MNRNASQCIFITIAFQIPISDISEMKDKRIFTVIEDITWP